MVIGQQGRSFQLYIPGTQESCLAPSRYRPPFPNCCYWYCSLRFPCYRAIWASVVETANNKNATKRKIKNKVNKQFSSKQQKVINFHVQPPNDIFVIARGTPGSLKTSEPFFKCVTGERNWNLNINIDKTARPKRLF